MKKWISLIEGLTWFSQYSVGDHQVDVYRNLSKNDFLRLLKQLETQHGMNEWPVRAFITPTDLYVWDAYLATHSDMRDFDIPSSGGYLYLNRDSILFNDLDWEYNDDGEKYRKLVKKYYHATIINPYINKIYSNISIIGADDSGELGPKGRFAITPEFIETYVE